MRRLALLLPLALAACVPQPKAPPRPVPAPPAPPAPVPPAPAETDWRDIPLTPGTWRYAREGSGSIARYGRPGLPPEASIRCDPATHGIALSRGGTAPSMTVRTSYSSMTWPAAPGGLVTTVTLAARDPFLDRIAFSRGRFSIASNGLPTLYLPAWAEPARVVEDCR